eukprot:TRINITY_DN279_c0_g1_i1.p1 TRINITY_DN279_c0_g1~~TRINITY_DN279_c0_g1_i1.p1  ORF type:complete len:499 (-),score=191.25 TRINITY_DN279_c0_g1_i1:109-1605(-)
MKKVETLWSEKGVLHLAKHSVVVCRYFDTKSVPSSDCEEFQNLMLGFPQARFCEFNAEHPAPESAAIGKKLPFLRIMKNAQTVLSTESYDVARQTLLDLLVRKESVVSRYSILNIDASKMGIVESLREMGMSEISICSSILDGQCESVEQCITWIDENAVRLSDIETKVALAMSELPMVDDGHDVDVDDGHDVDGDGDGDVDVDGGDDGWFGDDGDLDMDMDMDEKHEVGKESAPKTDLVGEDRPIDDLNDDPAILKDEKEDKEGETSGDLVGEKEKESVEEKALRLMERARAERKKKEEQEAKESERQRRLAGKEDVSARVYYKQKERERHRMEVMEERKRKKREREALLEKIEADRLERREMEGLSSGKPPAPVETKSVVPRSTTSTSSVATECNIVLQAPDGHRSRVQLPLKATIHDVLNRAADLVPGIRFKLVCGYPKQTYQVGCAEESQTLQSLGLERSLFHIQKYEGPSTFRAGYHAGHYGHGHDDDDNAFY